MKMTESEEEAERRGFCQGIAWAISICFRYSQSAGGLLRESGMSVKDFRDAGVEGMDLQAVKRVAKIEGLK